MSQDTPTPRTDRLLQLIGQYGVQCSETRELAPTTEFAAMFKEIAHLEQQLIDEIHPCCMEWHTCTKRCTPLAENWRMDAKRLESELAAANEKLARLRELAKAIIDGPDNGLDEAWITYRENAMKVRALRAELGEE